MKKLIDALLFAGCLILLLAAGTVFAVGLWTVIDAIREALP